MRKRVMQIVIQIVMKILMQIRILLIERRMKILKELKRTTKRKRKKIEIIQVLNMLQEITLTIIPNSRKKAKKILRRKYNNLSIIQRFKYE